MKNTTIKRVLALIRPYRASVAASLVFALFCAAIQLLIPILSGAAIDEMTGAGSVDFKGVAVYAALIGISALAGAVFQKLLAHCNNRITFSVCRDLRENMSKKLNRLPFSYLDTHQSGDTVSRMISDVDTFADGLLMGFTQLFTGVVTIVATLGIMLYMNYKIALVVVLLTPLSIFTAKFIAGRIQRFFKEQAEIRGEQTAFINETIEGQRVIRAFGYESESMAKFDETNERLAKASLFATFFSSLTNPSTRMVNNIVYAAVAFISALYAAAGGITVGQFSVFLSYASQYAKPFNEISGVVAELQNALACAARIFELLDEREEIHDTDRPENPPVCGSVSLENVSFRYVQERPLIENFTLSVKPGQRIAIVGPTGCGKTTLINLLMRFYDVDSGCIRTDGADIRNMTRHNLRSRYGMVLQETWLCAGTVAQNIAYGKPGATQEEIELAAKAAHAHSFINRLPNGYDTFIAEGGASLSVGQRQLLCIARAMLALPEMLILDEATSSIDTRTEQKVQAAFAKMMAGRTSFVVAHRLSTIRESDVILVMKDGHIIEQGNHNELIANGGFYASLLASQGMKIETA